MGTIRQRFGEVAEDDAVNACLVDVLFGENCVELVSYSRVEEVMSCSGLALVEIGWMSSVTFRSR